MQHKTHGAYILSVGLAMFSMFFGAGNVVFPLLVGMRSEGHILAAILGLAITAVGVPMLGLYAMTFFDGEYRPFFNKMGRLPGTLVLCILMGLLGPFGALPRCIALSYSTCAQVLEGIHPVAFSLFSMLVIYFFTARKSRVVDLIGTVLTPILLFSLAVIIAQGIRLQGANSNIEPSHIQALPAFTNGLLSGYHTMDLLGSFFFCHFVVNALKKVSLVHGVINHRLLTKNTLRACFVGAFLLMMVYSGLAFIASQHTKLLSAVTPDRALAVLAYEFLGPWGGIVTCCAVVLACLTTAIALAAVFSEFLHKDLSGSKISYQTSLGITLAISFFISILEFQAIFYLLAPIVQALYPALIVLSLLNIASAAWKIPFGSKGICACTLLTALAALLM